MIGLWLATIPIDESVTRSWPVILLAIVTICLCVLVHYFILWDMIRRLNRVSVHSVVAICGTVLGLIVAHLIEIGLFALALSFLVMVWGDSVGSLSGQEVNGIQDWYYYSATVYTTVGFGDITPSGPLRIFAACESLSGLVLITWSASFTFLVMKARWRDGIDALHRSGS